MAERRKKKEEGRRKDKMEDWEEEDGEAPDAPGNVHEDNKKKGLAVCTTSPNQHTNH